MKYTVSFTLDSTIHIYATVKESVQFRINSCKLCKDFPIVYKNKECTECPNKDCSHAQESLQILVRNLLPTLLDFYNAKKES